MTLSIGKDTLTVSKHNLNIGELKYLWGLRNLGSVNYAKTMSSFCNSSLKDS